MTIEELQELRGAIQSVIESSQYQDDDWCENLLASMQTWRERIETIDHLTAQLAASQSENTKLRAALAVSKDPCIYCQLPADEMAKCQSGFPGCGRADDIVGRPHLGAELQLKDQLAAKDQERTDLAMLVRRLCHALSKTGTHPKVQEQSLDYLKRKGLQGDILRGGDDDAKH